MADLRTALATGPVHGWWSSLPGVAAVAAGAGLGLDFVVFDLQHGSVSEETLAASCAAAVGLGLAPLVRARSAAFPDVGRPIDLGAHGVIVPSVYGAAHAAEVVRSARYPPQGNRSTGRLAGGVDAPLVIPMIETAQALAELDAILALDGLDAVYVGPFDLALSLGGPAAIGGPQVAAAIDTVIAACTAAGVPWGIYTLDGAAAHRYAGRGCRLVTVTADHAALAAALRANADQARG
jgi:4-hydroxy-2-oxoheptanedioate aldolase